MDWVYHGQPPKAGRKLVLVSQDEILLVCPLIYRCISLANIKNKQDWYSQLVNDAIISKHTLLAEFTLYNDLFDQLRAVIELRKNKSKGRLFVTMLEQLNKTLNMFFSDYGWRQIRREISQIKKRQKKGHIEVSKDIIDKLKRYMEIEKFDSFDQAIDTLIADYEGNNFKNRM